MATLSAKEFMSSRMDYDVTGVVNSHSDSIYISLMHHARTENGGSDVDGFVFVHNCPHEGLGGKGELFRITAALLPEPPK